MAWITLSSLEVQDLRFLAARAAEVLGAQVVDGLQRRFGDAAGVDRTRDGLAGWAARLDAWQASAPDGSVRLSASWAEGIAELLGRAHVWLAALERVRGPEPAAGLPVRLAQVAEGLRLLLDRAHAGPDPTLTTLGTAPDPDHPDPGEEHP